MLASFTSMQLESDLCRFGNPLDLDRSESALAARNAVCELKRNRHRACPPHAGALGTRTSRVGSSMVKMAAGRPEAKLSVMRWCARLYQGSKACRDWLPGLDIA